MNYNLLTAFIGGYAMLAVSLMSFSNDIDMINLCSGWMVFLYPYFLWVIGYNQEQDADYSLEDDELTIEALELNQTLKIINPVKQN